MSRSIAQTLELSSFPLLSKINDNQINTENSNNYFSLVIISKVKNNTISSLKIYKPKQCQVMH